jgi:hypothetical protein
MAVVAAQLGDRPVGEATATLSAMTEVSLYSSDLMALYINTTFTRSPGSATPRG